MASNPQPWTLATCRRDIPALYNAARGEGALEWQSIKLWSTISEVWAQNSGVQHSIAQQIPPGDDPNIAERLRRIDFAVDLFDLPANARRFTLFFVEGKGEHAKAEEKAHVEEQALNACQDYMRNNRGLALSQIGCLCVVGTKARGFIYREENYYWQPVWGPDSHDFDISQYIDAGSRNSGSIWQFFNTMKDTCGRDLATPADMPIRAPPTRPGVLMSQTTPVLASSSRAQPQQVQAPPAQRQIGNTQQIASQAQARVAAETYYQQLIAMGYRYKIHYEDGQAKGLWKESNGVGVQVPITQQGNNRFIWVQGAWKPMSKDDAGMLWYAFDGQEIPLYPTRPS